MNWLEAFHTVSRETDTNCAVAAMRLFCHDQRFRRALREMRALGIDNPDADSAVSKAFHGVISEFLDETQPRLLGVSFAAWSLNPHHLAYCVGIDSRYWGIAQTGGVSRIPRHFIIRDYEVDQCPLF